MSQNKVPELKTIQSCYLLLGFLEADAPFTPFLFVKMSLLNMEKGYFW